MMSDEQPQPSATNLFESETLELSWRYAYRPEFVPLLIDYLGARPKMNVLEVGCGTGYLARLLARSLNDVHIVGLDPDRQLLDVARRLLEREELTHNVQFWQGDAYRLPFPDESFDMVTSQTLL